MTIFFLTGHVVPWEKTGQKVYGNKLYLSYTNLGTFFIMKIHYEALIIENTS